MEKKFIKKQWTIASCMFFGQMLLGYCLGWSAPIIPKLQDATQSPLGVAITETEASWIASLVLLGSMIGPFTSNYISNSRGRRPSLLLSAFLMGLSFLILAVAKNIYLIYLGRLVCGFGVGIFHVLLLVYLGEIGSTHIRGLLLTTAGIFNTLGTLFLYSIGHYVSYAAVSYVGLVLSVINFMGLYYFVIETPVFLTLKGRHEEARDTLIALKRLDEAEQSLTVAEKPIATEENKATWKDLFATKSNRKAFILMFVLFTAQSFSGVMVVMFFTTTIFQMAGSSVTPHLATIIIGLTQLSSSFTAPILVERSGRRVLLLMSTPVCFLSLLGLGTYFYFDKLQPPIIDTNTIRWLPLVTLILFFIAFDTGFSVIPGTLLGEMFEPKLRSLGSTIIISLGWLFNFLTSTAFGYMVTSLGAHYLFWIFSAPCAFAFFFTYFFIPETKGKSLYEIQEMLSK